MIGCKRSEPLSDQKEITSFAILKSVNGEKIATDVSATIDGKTILIRLSEHADYENLIATFETTGSAVAIGDVPQISGVTANNFSKSPVYIVKAEDGTSVNYILQVSIDKSAPLRDFVFEKAKNSNLSADVTPTATNNYLATLIAAKSSPLVATFTTDALSVKVNGKEQVSGVTQNDFTKGVNYTLTMRNGKSYDYTVEVAFIDAQDISLIPKAVPHFTITLNDPAVTEIPSKDYYLDGTLEVDGKGVYDNYKGITQIKGRGNSTWSYPKKPYRLKLDKKSAICGMTSAKNWVLLANYLDPSAMIDAVAHKISNQLGLPFSHQFVPVEVTLNGKYRGTYLLTEQTEINPGRVDIDSKKGVILEFDQYYDSDPKFRSTPFNLPVMLKDPDMTDAKFGDWKKDFETLCTKVNQSLVGSNYVDDIDIESVANYILVYLITLNQEISHPKSIYIHKQEGGKWTMGPTWDFDWGFGYDKAGQHFVTSTAGALLWRTDLSGGVGSAFFTKFLTDPRVTAILKKSWQKYRALKLPELMLFIDGYSAVITNAVAENSKVWSNTAQFPQKASAMKSWLTARATYLDTYINSL